MSNIFTTTIEALLENLATKKYWLNNLPHNDFTIDFKMTQNCLKTYLHTYIEAQLSMSPQVYG